MIRDDARETHRVVAVVVAAVGLVACQSQVSSVRTDAAPPVVVADSGYELVRIDPGTFDGVCVADARVTLTRPLLVGRTEVSVGLARDTLERARRDFSMNAVAFNERGCTGPMDLTEDLPLTCADWMWAVGFANELSVRDGLEPVYTFPYMEGYVVPPYTVLWRESADGYRLPTAAEWEVIASALGQDRHYAGADAPEAACTVGNVVDEASADGLPWSLWRALVAEPCDDGHAGLASVGSYEPDALGIFDLTGNVSEWTWDAFEDRPRGWRLDPKGAPPSLDYEGRWDDDAVGVTAMGSSYADPGRTWDHHDLRRRAADVCRRRELARYNAYPDVGFRLVRTPAE